jgi:hypothetical protein
MKLYTEEQVRKAIELSRDTHPQSKGYVVTDEYDYSMDEVVDLLTPIQLPSDEEIEKESFDLYAIHHTYSLNVRQYKAFKRGATWMRNKIQGGEQ